jgi:hypothetical protein
MKLSELPDVYRASLDEATFDTYLEDLRALDGPLEVRAKAAATVYAEERTWTLDDAVSALEAGAVRAVQVRYALDGQVWCDTIMGAGRGVPRQLVRMAALVAALLLCASGQAGAQSPSASPTDATAAPAEGDAVGAGDAEATVQEDVAPVPEEQPAPSEPPPEEPAAPAAWPFDWGSTPSRVPRCARATTSLASPTTTSSAFGFASRSSSRPSSWDACGSRRASSRRPRGRGPRAPTSRTLRSACTRASSPLPPTG